MEDPLLYPCPLCCNNSFESKQALVDHLISFSLNIVCTICNESFSSLELLTEHLKIDNCEALNPDEDVVLDNDVLCNVIKIESDVMSVNSDSTQDNEVVTEKNNLENNTVAIKLNNINNHNDGDKMYVELLRKQLAKPCLQTQEMKLVKEDGQSRYVILAEEESLMNQDVTIVTKQNNDGTISLTALKETESVPNGDSEMDAEPVSDDDRSEKNGEEIYTCNTCSVSFSSVLEHIQNYHNDEDVVVHDNGNTDLPLQFEGVNEETAADKQSSRRMITETGNIVEAPVVLRQTAQSEMKGVERIKIEPNVKKGHLYIGRLLQRNAAAKVKYVDQNTTYHKVVAKEMQTSMGNKVKLYNCMTCNIYVTSLAEFKQQPCKPLKYQCPQCPVSYDNSKSLCAHMKVHKLKKPDSNVPESKFECEICNTQFPTSKSLKLHKKMHDPIKSRPIEPPLETPEGMPASDDKYLCSTCNKLIPIDYRTIHQNSHKLNNTMNCDICNKKFHSKDYLEMHMAVHKVEKVVVEKSDKLLPYDCLYCARKFARPHEKVKHERIHTGEKPHSCEICGKSFRVSYCLTLHMRTHTGARPYACPHCNKRFKAHSVYNHHLLTHSDVRAYKCPFCPKAFKTSVQLAGHRNSHTKPFSCQQCNRPFASLYAVRVHMEIHTRQNILKFSCTLCGASYARAFALKDHVKQVHKQDIDTAENVTLLENKEWIIQENSDVDTERIILDKDLSPDMTDLGVTTELIIP